MPFKNDGSLKYFVFDSFEHFGLMHGVFTRHGGVSPAPWASLNVGGSVGDEEERVIENRTRTFKALGRDYSSIYDLWQVHGCDYIRVDAPRGMRDRVKADIMLTDQQGVTLYMSFADCVPILLVDPTKGAIGLVHAGWAGTVNRAAAAAVEALREEYGSNPADIHAGIGPSICVDHYPVGEEVVNQVLKNYGEDHTKVMKTINGAHHFDLWAANRLTLEQAGVRNIELAEICTVCHNQDWYSHRAEKGKTGRFCTLMAL